MVKLYKFKKEKLVYISEEDGHPFTLNLKKQILNPICATTQNVPSSCLAASV
jgi:hypothetical protein